MWREEKRRREGKENKGRDGGGKGKVTQGMGRTGQDMGWDWGREGGRGWKGRREAAASPKLPFLAPPLVC